jgi:hypothetical protein
MYIGMGARHKTKARGGKICVFEWVVVTEDRSIGLWFIGRMGWSNGLQWLDKDKRGIRTPHRAVVSTWCSSVQIEILEGLSFRSTREPAPVCMAFISMPLYSYSTHVTDSKDDDESIDRSL